MSTRRFLALLAGGVVTTVTCVLGVTVIVDRRAAREHAAHWAARGGKR